MKDSYSKKKAIEILERALSKKDKKSDAPNDLFSASDLEKMAAELDISKTELEQAATEINSLKEQNRNEMYPEVVTTRSINGKLTHQEIEDLLSELRIEFGGAKTWDGSPVKLHKIGKTWEYRLNDATILIKEEDNGYQLQVIKPQFFHGNKIEAGVLAIPLAFIVGLLPVTAAAEWIHIFSAIFIAAICYYFSFLLVKKFTNSQRSKTISKLLQITEYAEQKMKEMTGSKQLDLNAEFRSEPERVESTKNNPKEKQKS